MLHLGELSISYLDTHWIKHSVSKFELGITATNSCGSSTVYFSLHLDHHLVICWRSNLWDINFEFHWVRSSCCDCVTLWVLDCVQKDTVHEDINIHLWADNILCHDSLYKDCCGNAFFNITWFSVGLNSVKSEYIAASALSDDWNISRDSHSEERKKSEYWFHRACNF